MRRAAAIGLVARARPASARRGGDAPPSVEPASSSVRRQRPAAARDADRAARHRRHAALSAADLPQLRLQDSVARRRTVDGERYVPHRRRDRRAGDVRRRDAELPHACCRRVHSLATRTSALSPDAPRVTPARSAASSTTTCSASRSDGQTSLGAHPRHRRVRLARRAGHELAGRPPRRRARRGPCGSTRPGRIDFPDRLATLRVGDCDQRRRRLGPLGTLRRRAVRHQFRDAADAGDHAAAQRHRRGDRAFDGGRVRQRPPRGERGSAAGPVHRSIACRRSRAPARCRWWSPTRSAASR